MARPRKYVIKLTEDEYKELKSIIRKKATSKTIRCRWISFKIKCDKRY
ncbi:hypothetical protein NSB25_20310 [Acetatifactor muris]|uniref:Uncharacterized protein n=1 Tax=Acetatifactor muris TaxID=879566 RepID=A0A2K4ZKJ8_9FIRM|nr:hypothetical protein [Acetatifactor muris]MCR2049609.1 hypothetical protein [Acetatifactor muris]SOY31009.1 hypothetical protein AMURIS_03743 [Acetatifactor muris]